MANYGRSIGYNNAMAVAAPPSSPPPSRRRFSPRFGLAEALVAMSLAAYGCWWWFRVPFEVVHVTKGRQETEWVRRTWGGTLRHGERRVYLNDKVHVVEKYRDGIPHGRWECLDGAGKTCISAEFRLGRVVSFQASPECDQRLARLLAEGSIKDQRIISALMQPQGLSFYETPLEDVMQILFDARGVRISCQGLREMVVLKAPPPATTPPPPSETVRLNDNMLLHVPLDPEDDDIRLELLPSEPEQLRPIPPPRFIRQDHFPIEFATAETPLIAALGQMLQPHGLVCDYRYGMLWVAEREEAETWRDRTGVLALRPPRGSHLEEIWNERSWFEFVETPLADIWPILEKHHRIRFDTSRIPAPPNNNWIGYMPVNCVTWDQPFKNGLGAMLDNAGCRASLDGETIVIELQPVIAERPVAPQ